MPAAVDGGVADTVDILEATVLPLLDGASGLQIPVIQVAVSFLARCDKYVALCKCIFYCKPF